MFNFKTRALAAALLAATTVFATPPGDDVTKAEGCIDIPGGSGIFTLAVSYDAATGGTSGSLRYVDTVNHIDVSSATAIDYSYLDTNVRGFIFQGTGTNPNYNEIRVFVSDWGATGDEFEIQLLQNGTIVYDKYNTLSSNCKKPGINGVVIASNVNIPCDCPGQPPKQKPPFDHGKGHHLHGNNGVGNGVDPQPPGNPPINDGPGTGPGNPGNRGGAHK